MSSSVNRVILLGNLTRDPEMKFTTKGTAIIEFGMAMNHTWTTDSGEKREEVTFMDVSFFGRSAEIIEEYVKKGHKLFIEGRLKQDSWDDKQTGKKRYAIRVVGETFTLLPQSDGKARGDDRAEAEAAARSRGRTDPAPAQSGGFKKSAPPQQRKPPPDPDLDAADEEQDIPF